MNKTAFLLFLLFLGFVSGCQKKAAPAGRRIDVVMKKYSIQPAEIRMKSGETVDLEITTADVQHGFDVPQLGIKEPVQPGKTTSVVLKAPAPGEYAVRCGIICGPHHEDMTAKLVVN